MLDKLAEKKYDELGVSPTRVLGTVRLNRLVIDVPKRVKKCVIQPKSGLKYKDIKQFKLSQPILGGMIAPMPGYETHVIEATETDGVFAVDISVV